jgi:hypothetical protein
LEPRAVSKAKSCGRPSRTMRTVTTEGVAAIAGVPTAPA